MPRPSRIAHQTSTALIGAIRPKRMLLTSRALEISADQRANLTWLKLRGNKKLFCEAVPEGFWAGSRCFIIGGGPSLRGFDFSILSGERVIAINVAFIDAPFSEIFFSMDYRLYRWLENGHLGRSITEAWRAFRGYKVFLDTKNFFYSGVYVIRGMQGNELSSSMRDGIYTGNNSGFGALSLAVLLRASPIYLLGFDMKHAPSAERKARTHYHARYPSAHPESTIMRFGRNIDSIAQQIAARGISVINLNPNSGLRNYRFSTIGEVMHERGEDMGRDAPVLREGLALGASA